MSYLATKGACFGECQRAVYTPAITLWALLSQVSHVGELRSCTAAVARVIVLLVALGHKPCSTDTGAYCRAREKLPEAVIRRLALDVGNQLEARVPADWLWLGRHVKIADGTMLSMPDTPANQKAYPQQRGQQPGLGFPILRLVVLLSLATAALCGMALAPHAGKGTGESTLLRSLFDRLQPGDVLVGDRHFGSYFLLALGLVRGVDWVARVHQPGFRVKPLVLVTTLTDSERYPMQAIAQLYRARWQVELDLRAIKQSLSIEPLRCKSPEMIGKEIWAHWLAYNLIRKTIAASWDLLSRTPHALGALASVQWTAIASHPVGHRPDRVEPRAVKRRPKPQRLLTQPRAQARAELLCARQQYD